MKRDRILNRTGAEPRFGQPRGAPARAERKGFVGEKRLGGALRRHRNGGQICKKSYSGVHLQRGSKPFHAKLLTQFCKPF